MVMQTRKKNNSQNLEQIFRLNPLAYWVRAVMAGGVILGNIQPVQADPAHPLPVAAEAWSSAADATMQTVGNTMNIDQKAHAGVVYNWQSFDVGTNNTVNFIQPSETAIAVNQIAPSNIAPSQILGQINANGQVYLINPNGFVFGANSVVDTHGLVASTLKPSDDVINSITSNNGGALGKQVNLTGKEAFAADGQFYLANGQLVKKNADGSYTADINGKKVPVEIKIMPGAKITSENGRAIMMFAPVISNEGDIKVKSPDAASSGQVILAAATDKVYLQEAPSAGYNSDVRGLLVEVKTGGKVENLGSITANHGNVTLMGYAVNQQGRISASTSINENGTIRLLAREGGSAILPTPTIPTGTLNTSTTSTKRDADNGDGLGTSATVTLGAASTTEILPEVLYVDGVETTAPISQGKVQSRLEIMGHDVRLEGAGATGSGAKIDLPAGKVDVTATSNPGIWIDYFTAGGAAPNLDTDTNSVSIGSGASINVSGLDAYKTMESNVVSVKLQSNELADAPLQKNGVLFGKTVQIDLRTGSPLVNLSVLKASIPQTLAERMSNGGSINLNSEGSVRAQSQSQLNFSGGTVHYNSGYINTTKLMSGGRSYDIGSANPLMTFDSIYGQVSINDPKWAVTSTWNLNDAINTGRFEQAYDQGANAGSLSVFARSAVMDATLQAHAVSGTYQRAVNQRANGGALSITGLLEQNILFDNSTQIAVNTLLFDPNMFIRSGIQSATLKTSQNITIAANTTLQVASSGSLTLQGTSVDVLGNIRGAGATVSLQTNIGGDGHVNIGCADATCAGKIDLSGLWINDSVNQGYLANNSVLSIAGGTFKVNAQGDVNLNTNSSIDVSGGAWLQANRAIKAGDAGAISLAAAANDNTKPYYGSNLNINGVLSGYGLSKGGSLSLESNAIRIGGSAGSSLAGLQPLQLDSGFFGRGGFANYTLTSNIGGLELAAQTSISLSQVNRQLNTGYLAVASADNIAAISTIARLPVEQRQPSSLTLNSFHTVGFIDNNPAGLRVGAGSNILADNLSTVNLNSDTAINFNGGITAHGGSVAMQIVKPVSADNDLSYVSNQGIWLGHQAAIDVSGTSVVQQDSLGHRGGSVYDGGSVSLIAQRGFIAAQSGSVIDASGTQAVLDLPQQTANGLNYRAQTVGSNGGAITLQAAEGLFVEGVLRSVAGNAGHTAGGSLIFSLDGNQRISDISQIANTNFPITDRIIKVSENDVSIFTGNFANPGDSLASEMDGVAYISASKIQAGGFSSVKLHAENEIRFQDSVDLKVNNSLQLDAPKFAWERHNGVGTDVKLQANSAIIGFDSTNLKVVPPVPENPASGNGRLAVEANLIELQGRSVASGFSSVSLEAAQDIQLLGRHVLADTNSERVYNGGFTTYSQLVLTADRIYPDTLSRFTLQVLGDGNGAITFNSHAAGVSGPLLSAGGSLSVNAPNIQQNGRLLAPLGTINLFADSDITFGANSLTSVSAGGAIIPFGTTSAGTWLYPFEAGNLIIQGAQKSVSVQAQTVHKGDGAVIDLSGGGDIMAYEFVPGNGGTKDVLASGNGIGGVTSYAILPGLTGFAPYDPFLSSASGLSLGQRIHLDSSVLLADGSALAAGDYTLLPAHYALLSGAYLITPQAFKGVVPSDYSSSRIDGAQVVSGYYGTAGTDLQSQSRTAFVIEAGSAANTRSQYSISHGNDFLVTQAALNKVATPVLAQDAGQLAFNVGSYLDLPTLRTSGVVGAQVDISANEISVVNTKTGANGVVELLASDIENNRIASLFLGGARSKDVTTGVTQLTVNARRVTVGDGVSPVKLQASEVLLGATEQVRVTDHAVVSARGLGSGIVATTLSVDGDNALLRVALGGQDVLRRSNPPSSGTGNLLIDSGALLSVGTGINDCTGNCSILMDATGNTALAGSFAYGSAGGSLSIGANAVNLGETENAGALYGVSLSNSQLGSLNNLSQLTLNSRGMINIYGDLRPVVLDAKGNTVLEKFGNLLLDSAGLAGYNNEGKTALINAGTLTLKNSAATGTSVFGGGNLLITADNLILAGGNYSLSGFAVNGSAPAVQINVRDSITGRGNGRLNLEADSQIYSGSITGISGASTTINAAGYNLVLGKTLGGEMASAGVGAKLNVAADTLLVDTALNYRAGSVNLTALQGGSLAEGVYSLNLGEHAVVDVSAVSLAAGLNAPVKLAGGDITLSSQRQNIKTEAGSRLLLGSNLSGIAAGSLNINAASGLATFAGTVTAAGTDVAHGGRLNMDVLALDNSLNPNGFSELNSLMSSAGLSGQIGLRLRQGDILIDNDQIVTAKNINISADSGSITVNGVLDASGASGGSIVLSAPTAVYLNTGSKLLANATRAAGDGGSVMLDTAHQTAADTGNAGSSVPKVFGVESAPGIRIASGAMIDVSAQGGKNGDVRLRADRMLLNNKNDVNVTSTGTIVGATPVIEAVEYYSLTNVSASNISNIKTDTNSYMTALSNNVDLAGRINGAYTVTPGIEVYSAGDLVVNGLWDLAGWRYGANQNTPGVLNLRVAGNLTVNQSITDGFKISSNNLDGSAIYSGAKRTVDMIQSGDSWTYNLIAGADLSAANRLTIDPATQAQAEKGDLTLAANTAIRTGTGDITVKVARDLKYLSDTSVIYTAGKTDAVDPYGFSKAFAALYFPAQYTSGGGDVNVEAGRDISGVASTQLISEWLVRIGNWTGANTMPTAWGLQLSNLSSASQSPFTAANTFYRESLGALGGGNVTVKAGGNISDLSVAIPTTGKQIGENTPAVHTNNVSPSLVNNKYTDNRILVQGGGDLNLSAGGDIKGGVFYVDGTSKGVANGRAYMYAGGSVLAGSNTLNPILAVGDSQMTVTAVHDLAIETVLNPMVVPQLKSANGSQNRTGIGNTVFFEYSAASAVGLNSLAGDITLSNDATGIAANMTRVPQDQATLSNYLAALTVYPASLTVNALGGDLNIRNSLTLFPSPSGNLQLYADKSILLNTADNQNAVSVILSDADPAYLPSVARPAAGNSTTAYPYGDALQRLDPNSKTAYAVNPLHKGDGNPVLISTGSGDIRANNSTQTEAFYLAKQARVQAGNDIRNVSFYIQHDDELSNSLISAGRDITFDIQRDALGAPIGSSGENIQVSGPGQLTVVSTRNIDLGASNGIRSVGNLGVNTHLPVGGASLNVIAGLAGKQLNVTGFANNFFSRAANSALFSSYKSRLLQLMIDDSGDGSLTYEQALSRFEQLADSKKASYEMLLFPFVEKAYVNELQALAQERAAAVLTTDKDRLEFAMLATVENLFPGTTLLSGNPNYAYDTSRGWTVDSSTSYGEIIRGMDIKLLAAIKGLYGNTVSLDVGNSVQIDQAISKIEGSADSGYGKSVLMDIFSARPDIKDAVRPSDGKLALFFSTIQTMDGGNLNIYTPNGGIDAGLAASSLGFSKSAAELGIMVQQQGDLTAILRDDFAVNLTRVMTSGGGSVVVGSTEGSIDAGRGTAGASAITASVSYDPNSNPLITFPPDVSTSGIRSASPSGSKVKPGPIVLFAPRGVIDAGEAGIAGGNLFLDASSFKNVANISTTGVSVGAPSSAPASVSVGLVGASSITASVTKAIESASDVGKEVSESRVKASAALGILNVELLGFGD
jgi:filamentous hemagglutinin family protein